MISQKRLEEFKIIYFEEYKIQLNNQEATEMATELLNLMRILTRPEPKEDEQTK